MTHKLPFCFKHLLVRFVRNSLNDDDEFISASRKQIIWLYWQDILVNNSFNSCNVNNGTEEVTQDYRSTVLLIVPLASKKNLCYPSSMLWPRNINHCMTHTIYTSSLKTSKVSGCGNMGGWRQRKEQHYRNIVHEMHVGKSMKSDQLQCKPV